MAERNVSVEISIDPAKAESGARRVVDAVNKAEQRGNVVSGFQLNRTQAANAASPWIQAGLARGAAARAGGASGSGGGGTAAAAGALGGQKTAVLVRLIPSQYQGILSLRSGAGGGPVGPPDTTTKEKERETKSFTQSLREARTAILAAGAAATGFLAAGNPMLFKTFTGSIQLLGARISELLIPAFLSASGVIQGWANTINSLSPATKEFLGAVIKWGGAIVLTTVVISKIISVGESLAVLFRTLGAAAIWARGAMFGLPAAQAGGAAAGAAAGSAIGAATGSGAAGTAGGAGAAAGGGAGVGVLAALGFAAAAFLGYQIHKGGSQAAAAGGSYLGGASATALRPLIAPAGAVAGLFQQGWSMRPGGPTASPNGQPNRPPLLFSNVQQQFGGGEEFYNAVLTQAVAKAEGDQELMRAIMFNTGRTVELLSQLYGGGTQAAVNTAQTLGPAGAAAAAGS